MAATGACACAAMCTCAMWHVHVTASFVCFHRQSGSAKTTCHGQLHSIGAVHVPCAVQEPIQTRHPGCCLSRHERGSGTDPKWCSRGLQRVGCASQHPSHCEQAADGLISCELTLVPLRRCLALPLESNTHHARSRIVTHRTHILISALVLALVGAFSLQAHPVCSSSTGGHDEPGAFRSKPRQSNVTYC